MRIVEILVGLSAIGSIATFLGFRAMFRKTVKTLGRKPPPLPPEERHTEVGNE